jgi:DNA-binding transcriptional LysR family regulator
MSIQIVFNHHSTMIESLSELRAFGRVVETGGFTAAARSLALSTAMVSRHVASLEGRLGVRLLDRNTRRSAPTAAGLRFYERCLELLNSLAEAESELVHESRDARGTLRVSMPPEFGTGHLAPLLPAFMRRHPQLQLQLALHNRMADLVEEGLDAAVRFTRQYDASINGRRLGVTRLVLAAAPAYVRANGLPRTPQDLASHRGLVYGNPEPWAAFPWQHGGAEGTLNLVPWFVASSSEMVCRAAMAGLGLAIVPTLDAGRPLQRGELVRLLPDYDFGVMNIYVVYPTRRHLPVKVRAFVDFMAECFGGDADVDPFVDGLHQPTEGPVA